MPAVRHIPHKRRSLHRKGPEADLVSTLAQWMVETTSARPSWLGVDVPLGAGTPDIVLVLPGNGIDLSFRPALSDAEILAYLRSVAAAAPATVAARINQPAPDVQRRLEQLARWGGVEEAGAAVRLSAAWRADTTAVVTIEAKIGNWKRALGQAKRNRLFATQSYIAVPEPSADRIAGQAELCDSGVGLLAVDQLSGDVNCVAAPRPMVPQIWSYYYLAICSAARFPKGRMDGVSGFY